MTTLDQYQGLREPLLVDTAEARPVHLLIGRNGAQIRLSANAYTLLHHFAAGGTTATFLAQLDKETGARLTPMQVESAYRHLLMRLAAIETGNRHAGAAFWLRYELLPAAAVGALAERWRRLYQPHIAVPLVSLLILFWLGYGWLAQGSLFPRAFLAHTTWASWGGAYLLFLLSVFAHELGHAAAARYYQLAPGPIGFAVYLLYPAFYSDVSAAWRLPRGQRGVIDLGGAYFQSLFALGCGLLYSVTGWSFFVQSIGLIGLSLLFALNPVFKFDGYWLLSDALGVTNLAQQPWRLLRHALAAWRGEAVAPLPWSPVVLLLLIGYTWLSVIVWVYFIGRFLYIIFQYLRL